MQLFISQTNLMIIWSSFLITTLILGKHATRLYVRSSGVSFFMTHIIRQTQTTMAQIIMWFGSKSLLTISKYIDFAPINLKLQLVDIVLVFGYFSPVIAKDQTRLIEEFYASSRYDRRLIQNLLGWYGEAIYLPWSTFHQSVLFSSQSVISRGG